MARACNVILRGCQRRELPAAAIISTISCARNAERQRLDVTRAGLFAHRSSSTDRLVRAAERQNIDVPDGPLSSAPERRTVLARYRP
jgi:hypothetical protein